jgi:hypothetical protein
MSFEENIKKWVALDNQLKTLTDKTKQVREDKNSLEKGIMTYVETNNLANATVNISDGKLRFISAKQTAPLTLKHVEDSLRKCIGNENQVIQIMKFIKDTREVKYSADIKRYASN